MKKGNQYNVTHYLEILQQLESQKAPLTLSKIIDLKFEGNFERND
jgi:hypothetical protein